MHLEIKVMKCANLFITTLFALGVLLGGVPSASAIDAFKKEFDNKYVKKESDNPAEKSLADAVAQVKCNVCHSGKTKKERNEYGKALATLLSKKTDAKNVEKIRMALETAAAMKSDPNNAAAPTFGELLSAGKLPGGDGTVAAAK